MSGRVAACIALTIGMAVGPLAASAMAAAPATQEQQERVVTFLALALDIVIIVTVGVLLLFFVVRYGRVVRNRKRPERTELKDLWSLEHDDADDNADAPPDR